MRDLTEAVWHEIQSVRDGRGGRTTCFCGASLSGIDVETYPHGDGWKTDIGKVWIYVTCPKCGYQWAIWKLGVSREHNFETR